MGEPKLAKFALVRPLGTSFRFSSKPKPSNFNSSHGEVRKDIQNTSHYKDHLVRGKITKTITPRAKSSDSKDISFTGAYKSSTNEPECSVMQTLDRKISASSDQLDTLKKLKNH